MKNVIDSRQETVTEASKPETNPLVVRRCVFGTAGHIDHGKTTLVRALTGIDTDRLAEEKRRGISIDLGFADLTLPSKRRVALIDVPGHERFIRNMLAGAAGIDAVILVVAADEGVMPQTREHFEICRLLGVSEGVVAITKSDLAGADALEAVRRQIRELTKGSFLETAPAVAVSASTKAGLSELLAELDSMADRIPERSESGLPRLPIDRSFVMQGFGTVVTGTLIEGALRTGDMVELHPLRKHVRIRGLQVHRRVVQVALAGQRTAVNLAGIDVPEIHRGDVLTKVETFEEATIFDASVEWLHGKQALRMRQALQLYAGCVETGADVRLLQPLGPVRTLSRISSQSPLVILPGDRFVLRNAETTVAGGVILDAFPPVRINREKTRKRLGRLLSGDEGTRLRLLVEESTHGRKVLNVVRLTGWSPERIRNLVQADNTLTFFEQEQRIISNAWLAQKRQQISGWVESYHKLNPSAAGAPLHQLRSSLMSGLETAVGDVVLRGIPNLKISSDVVSLASHAAMLNPKEQRAREELERLYRNAGFQPPAQKEALAATGLPATEARGHLEALVKAGRLVRVSPDILFHADAVNHVSRSLASHRGRSFSVPEFKEWTNISRKYAIPLLEFLDRQRVTRRLGDMREVL